MIRLAARPVGVALLAALSLCAGCVSSQHRYFFGGLGNPFGRANIADERKYGPIQKQVRRDIRELAAEAPELSPQEQEQAAFNLSQKLPNETNPALRVEMVRALGALATPTAETALQVALADSDKRVRVAAVEAWSYRSSPQSVAVLSRVTVEETDVDVRLAAVRALGDMGRPEAASALVAVLEENNPAVQHRAVESLQAISGRDYGADKEAWRMYAQGFPPPEPNHQRSWAQNIWPWQ